MAAVKGKSFSEALKDRYKEEFEIASILDAKANNMITISSAVGTLLFGFGTFFIDKLDLPFHYSIIVSVILIGGISLNILSMVVCVRASKIRDYRYVLVQNIFLKKVDDPIYMNQQIEIIDIERIDKLEEDEFYSTMIKAYLDCIPKNSLINDEKAKKIRFSQTLFTLGVFTILAITIFLLIITNSNYVIKSSEKGLTKNLTLGNPFYQNNGEVKSYRIWNAGDDFAVIVTPYPLQWNY